MPTSWMGRMWSVAMHAGDRASRKMPMLTVVTVCDGLATARSWKGCASKELFAQGLACEKRSERVGISVFDLARGPHSVCEHRRSDARL